MAWSDPEHRGGVMVLNVFAPFPKTNALVEHESAAASSTVDDPVLVRQSRQHPLTHLRCGADVIGHFNTLQINITQFQTEPN